MKFLKFPLGVLLWTAGFGCLLLGFSLMAPPIGAVLRQVGTDVIAVSTEIATEHPIATGFVLAVAGIVAMVVSTMPFRKKKMSEPTNGLAGSR